MPGPVTDLRDALRRGEVSPRRVCEDAVAHANSNIGHNVYIAIDPEHVLREADELPSRFPSEKPLLYGLPVSLKDCFDLAGYPTSAGVRYYAEKNGVAAEDSAVATRLHSLGAIVIGKTHLHPLAYGITGENRDYGDCAQPRDATRLTGGSSSGAAASVQEGSAIAAIGTDTGGSIRAPAALCGLAGYRASIDLAHQRGLWRGGIHLAQSFDTLGWLFRDLRDASLLGEALFGLAPEPAPTKALRIGSVSKAFLRGCDLSVMDVFGQWQERLIRAGAQVTSFDAAFWEDALEIYLAVQGAEATAIHTPLTGGDFSHFPPAVAERLYWGASLDPADVEKCRARHAEFRARMDQLLSEYDFLIAPCGPVDRLTLGADNSQARRRILRYTVPMSLTGAPVVTLSDPSGAGVQLIAARGADARLLAFAASLTGSA
jgi:Asp-tRNA(Asn)/Glu-tRNA(Gln) amidotransferase A subunit family amidase